MKKLNPWIASSKKNDSIIQMKKALIDRDPLWEKLWGEIKKHDPREGELSKNPEIQRSCADLETKWEVGIILTAYARPDIYGLDQDEPPWGEKILILNEPSIEPLFSFRPFPVEYLKPVKPGELLLVINPSLLDNQDAKWVKKTLWEMIREHLSQKAEKQNNRETFSFLYNCKEKTFQNYIRWYDIHMQEHIGFRLIAFIEKQSKGNPQKAKELLEKIKKMPQKPQVGRPVPEKNKVVVNGEDKVEKGVKLVFEAIFRTRYLRKKTEPIIEEYDCPQHGNSCPESCDYYQKFLMTFNRLEKSYHKESLETLERLDYLAIPKSGRKMPKTPDY